MSLIDICRILSGGAESGTPPVSFQRPPPSGQGAFWRSLQTQGEGTGVGAVAHQGCDAWRHRGEQVPGDILCDGLAYHQRGRHIRVSEGWNDDFESRAVHRNPLLKFCVLNLVGNRSVAFVTVSCTGRYALWDGCRTGSVSWEGPLCPHCHQPNGILGYTSREWMLYVHRPKSLNGMMLKYFTLASLQCPRSLIILTLNRIAHIGRLRNV